MSLFGLALSWCKNLSRNLIDDVKQRKQNSLETIKHLMTGPKGNSEFCFLETPNVPRGEAEENIEGRGETKLTVSRGASN